MSHNHHLKVDAGFAKDGVEGESRLAAGERIAMRMWDEGPVTDKNPASRPYETVGYVLEGEAILRFNNEEHLHLKVGDSWVVPQGMSHTYEVAEHFKAVEAYTK